eukprot:13687065-Ditylum_brightwellii.AAC.1
MDHGPIPLQTPHAGRHFTPTHPGIISKKGIPRRRGGKRNGRFTEALKILVVEKHEKTKEKKI